MYKIIIYGDCNKKLIGMKLCNALSRHGGVLYFCGGKAREISIGNPNFIVYETDFLQSLNIKDCVIIFNNNDDKHQPNIISSTHISCIVNAQNSVALSQLLNLSLPAIVYGMSPRDSITISSINDTDAVICVQRELVLQSGKVLEPCEFKVLHTEHLDEDDIMTISSVLILYEKFKDGIIEI